MKTAKIMMLMAAMIIWGCSSDKDENNSGKYSFYAGDHPTWNVDMTYNDPYPSWTAPDPALFESSMFIMVKLQDELVPYSNDDDLMTVFINGECRAKPAIRNVDQNGNIYFVLKIRGNGNDRDVLFSLIYYSGGLHHLFTLNGTETFATEITYGYDEDFVPPLILGNSKYPVQNSLTVNIPDNSPFMVSEGDCVGVFVGNECRGTGIAGEPITVFRKSADEPINLRYYSTIQGGVYIMKQSFNMDEDEEKDITLNF